MTYYKRTDDDLDRGLIADYKLDDLRRVPTDGIIAHYKMNDTAVSTTVIDSKGGNNGTSKQTTDLMTVAGKINNALSFASVNNDYVACGTSAKPANQLTFSLWINVTSAVGYERWIATAESTDLGGYQLKNLGNTKFNFKINANGTIYALSADNTFNLSQWYHVVCTYDNSKMKMYIDGVLQSHTTSVTGDIQYNANDLTIGNSSNLNRACNALIDDVRIYDRALSASEVSTIYNSGTGTETTELFREVIVAKDRKGFNDGTIYGCTDAQGDGPSNYKLKDVMSFDGIDDKVVTPGIMSGLEKNGFTISAWVNLTGKNDGTAEGIFSRRDVGDTRIYLSKEATKHFQFKLYTNTNVVKSDNIIEYERWYHLVGVCQKGGNLINLYVNGVKQSGTGTESGGLGAITNNYIGSIVNGAHINGDIGRVKVWNRALTDGEISKLYRLKR